MTYTEAVGKLLSLRGGEQAGMRPGLERIHALLDALGHPERRLGIVQVGGTNGKGSIAVMAASILKAAGRRVALYTSPHLRSFRERIRVDGQAISQEAVIEGVERLWHLVERVEPTVFEAVTALALAYFARQKVELTVLEVGMGGRLDATTVGRPLVSVISHVDYDHQAFLGWSLEEIAREKAAIIRSGMALAASQAAIVTDILCRRAAEVGIPLWLEGRDLSVRLRSRDLSGQRLDLSGPGWTLDDVFVPLGGSFQPQNALLAVAAVKALAHAGVRVPDEAIRQGLERVRWPGRFEIVGRDPWLVLDGAHNPAGAQALAVSLRDTFGDQPKTLIVGISADKDKAGILKALAPAAARLILTASTNPRATPPEELRALLPPTDVPVDVAPSVREALALALAPPATPIVCVTGSLFTVADALAIQRGGGDIPCEIERGSDRVESLFS
ncbi:MAG: bifunctional folylpolyglutamate synthase/dihydrofolate synthase [Candidatus Rokubacteria bacterium]|nr:bifunctional folylpolyglutamate synthase/dihydrofolate synthase [Candidatus Rokubacteria bacterium]